MLNTVPSTLATKLARYCSSSARFRDRKSTRLNSCHLVISYAVFCLKKKKNTSHLASMLFHTLQSPEITRCNLLTQLLLNVPDMSVAHVRRGHRATAPLSLVFVLTTH